ncbi:MAG: IPT/TIG domain-containing protein [Deltaproteobacteria bacterium]|nr:IPT/TIG domain-containing protein [Deltaproteobacteria bacterium]
MSFTLLHGIIVDLKRVIVLFLKCSANAESCEKRVNPSAWLAFLILSGCCCSTDRFDLPALSEPSNRQSDAALEDDSASLLDIDAQASELLVIRMVPASGPFVGGNQVLVRGSGFTSESRVYIGGRMVRSQDATFVDTNRLSIIVPAGEPGPSDVLVERGSDSATLEGGYTYSALYLDPASGSTAGGTLVEIIGNGTAFSEGVEVRFDSEACLDVRRFSPTRLSCRTPPMRAGAADVTVFDPASKEKPLVAEEAFLYIDTANATNGGLAGEPIEGTINVTVFDSTLGIRLQGVFVMVGDDINTPLQGLTDERGQITFSDPGLAGPVTVHAALKCFEKGSIVSFDATDVTIFLRTLIGIDPACMDFDLFEFEIPDLPEDSGRAMTTISGELVLPQRDEFYYNDWNRIPQPRDNEQRVIYIFTTQASATSLNPNPKTAEGLQRVVEGETAVANAGFPYKITSRSGGLAVYALAGIENRNKREFFPYLMGVTRDVIATPGKETNGVDILVDIPLDREFQVKLLELPQSTPEGPLRFRAQAHVDLGGQGVIVREVNGNSIDLVSKSNGDATFRFLAQPAMIDSLADGRYALLVGWYTGSDDEPPYTAMIKRGVEQSVEPLVLRKELLGLPQAVAPKDGESIPQDRILSWTADGPQPDLHIVTIEGGDGYPAWRQIVPGRLRETPIPDLGSIANLQDIAQGRVIWKVRAVRIPEFRFNQFQYDVLSSRYWTHDALNAFGIKR